MTTATATEARVIPKTPSLVWLLCAVLLAWIVVVVTAAQWQMAGTYDEQNHVTRGIAILRTGDYRLSLHHPPLANILEGLPVAWGTHGFTTRMPAWRDVAIWQAAYVTIWRQAPDGSFAPETARQGVTILRLARLPVLLFTLLLAVVVFLWARELFGPWGGLLSLTLLALDPNILAHSGLATTDLAATCTIFLAIYLLRGYLLRPGRGRLVLAGVGLGLALTAKFSSLILIPIMGLLLAFFALWPWLAAGLPNWQEAPLGSRLRRAVGVGIAVLGIGLVTLWAVYGFRVEPLGKDIGQPLPANASLAARVPIPAKQYLRGIKTVKTEAEGHRAYLLGKADDTGKGWWYYFPVAIATKTPIPELFAVLGALALLLIPRARRALGLARYDLLFLLVTPGIFLLAALGILGISLNLGIRHVLPIYPFLLVLAGGWAALPIKRRAYPLAIGVLLALQAFSVGAVYPNFLAYFNEIAGGPEDGYHVLADSNFDWGQDLGALAALQKEKHLYPLTLSYFGTTPPEAYGLTYTPAASFGVLNDAPAPDFSRMRGYLAISATNLVGGKAYTGVTTYGHLLDCLVDHRAGQTIFVYQFPLLQQNALPTRSAR